MYLPYAQRPERGFFLVVHTAADPLAASEAVRSAVRRLDAGLPLANVTTMERLVAAGTRERRAAGAALAGFSAAAVLLAALGLYALVAHAARDRTSEIGARNASRIDAVTALRSE